MLEVIFLTVYLFLYSINEFECKDELNCKAFMKGIMFVCLVFWEGVL